MKLGCCMERSLFSLPVIGLHILAFTGWYGSLLSLERVVKDSGLWPFIYFYLCVTHVSGTCAGLADTAHVIKDNEDNVYTAILSLVDSTQGTNSFYKLQALEGDEVNRCAQRQLSSLQNAISPVEAMKLAWELQIKSLLIYDCTYVQFRRAGIACW